MYSDEYFDIYARNTVRCDNAFNTYGQRKSFKSKQALNRGEFILSVYFIKGESNSGKTRLANDVTEHIISYMYEKTGEPWSVYYAATKNALDDYRGEEIILMDESRGTAMTATEWLLLLDPYNASPAAARYKNKPIVASRVVIITSTIEPREFFYFSTKKDTVEEKIDQFIRRLTAYIHVYDVRDDGSQFFGISKPEKADPYRYAIRDKQRYKYSEDDIQWVQMTYDFSPEEKLSRDETITYIVNEVADRNDPDAMLQQDIMDTIKAEEQRIDRKITTLARDIADSAFFDLPRELIQDMFLTLDYKGQGKIQTEYKNAYYKVCLARLRYGYVPESLKKDIHKNKILRGLFNFS